MPLAQLADLAIPSTEPCNDVAWMNAVLSPSVPHAPLRPVPPFMLDDASAPEHGLHLPPSSFRLQFLRAWIAASGGCPDEVPDHA